MLIRHSLIYVAARFLPALLGLATTVVLTHMLLPAGYGVYGLALVIMNFGSDVAFDWLGISLMRFYQTRGDHPAFKGTIVVLYLGLVGLTALAAGLAWLAGLFAGGNRYVLSVGILLMCTYSCFELASRFEIAAFRPSRYLMMNLGRGIFSFAGAVGAAWLTANPIWTAAGLSAGMIIGAALGGPAGGPVTLKAFDWPLARSVLSFGLPIAGSMLAASTAFNGTRWLIQQLDSLQALGFFTAAYLLAQSNLSLIGEGVASAGYSLAVRALEKGDQKAARDQLRANCSLLLALLAPASLGLALTAHGLAATFLGAQYVTPVTRIVPWVAIGAGLFSFRANYFDHAFQLGRRPYLQIWVSVAAALIAIGVSVWLIPHFGPVGAAIALIVAMILSCALALILSRYAFPLPFPWDQALRVAGACAAMTIAVIAVPATLPASFVVQVVLGAIVYALAGLTLNVLNARQHLKALLSVGKASL